jgi:hypothetical protein
MLGVRIRVPGSVGKARVNDPRDRLPEVEAPSINTPFASRSAYEPLPQRIVSGVRQTPLVTYSPLLTARESAELAGALLAQCAIFLGGFSAIPRLEDVIGPGPWTLLVPTDDAFVNLSTEAMNRLLGHPLPLTELLRTHVVRGIVAGCDLAGEGSLLTAGGDHLPVDAFGDVVLIDGAQVVRADQPMACGVAHVIDRVLVRSSYPDRDACR